MNKLIQAVDELLHLNICDQEGLRPPSPQQWFDAFNKLAEAREEVDQDAQKAAQEHAVKVWGMTEPAESFCQTRKGMRTVEDFLAGAQWTSSRSIGEDGWISVEKELPKERAGWSHSEGVLICYNSGLVSYGAHCYLNRKEWVDYVYSNNVGEFVTHWMPLPKPPKQ